MDLFKSNDSLNMDDVVASREIFTDSKKSKRATDSDIQATFGTLDFEKIAKKIIEDGEIHLTTEQRRKMQETREKQIINLLARDGIDPRTKLPHPVARIENTLKEAKIHIDPFKSAEEQLETVLKAIRPIIPIKIEMIKVAVKVPAEHSAKAANFLHQYKITREEWGSSGEYMAMVEISPGLHEDFYTRLNKITAATCEARIIS